MSSRFDEEMRKTLAKESEIPEAVRNSLDVTYNHIKSQSKSKWRSRFIKKTIVAASCLLAVGLVATNSSVVAGVKTFFNDKGIVKVFEEGLFQTNNETINNEDIGITLDSYYYDSNKIALNLLVQFDDEKILDSIKIVNLDFRIRNGDGEYLAEMIPDTKPLKGELPHVINSGSIIESINPEQGKVNIYIILESLMGEIPPLNNAEIDIETVKLFNDRGELRSIDGSWLFAIEGIEGNKDIEDQRYMEALSYEYIEKNSSSDIELLSATATPSSFNIRFALDTILGDYDMFEMKLTNDKGETIEGRQGFFIEEKDGRTIISTNFVVSSYENANAYTLQIMNIGSRQQNRSFKYVLENQKIELVRNNYQP
ncbi:DUF4179 domain-containing protein [Desulfuribacillus alkaliarsenatis]|uniref:DUF4179 domain-containing protein n=1 Tax=Desulfuribacillus alkaliarsenatis TaxID=766136 RepID=A0A1E5G4W7_9FIRM|nr:DUF4179 domain-containing protein [Desulfuribacillus alkaliarsenatis]OEF98159.1 hypothetical protein BHF68_00260 [Desulfuribacillus alkaliarsenatis]